MRETLAGFVFLLAVAAAYPFFKTDSPNLPLVSAGDSKKVSKNLNYKGVYSERNAHQQDQRDQKLAAGEGTSSGDWEGSGDHSIYPKAKRKFNPSVKNALPEEANEALTEENTEARVFHGVPVDAWVLSRKDVLSVNKVPPPAPSQLRFFVQCMELEKGQASELKERECRELAQKSRPRSSILN